MSHSTRGTTSDVSSHGVDGRIPHLQSEVEQLFECSRPLWHAACEVFIGWVEAQQTLGRSNGRRSCSHVLFIRTETEPVGIL